jgi:hypothetical protein
MSDIKEQVWAGTDGVYTYIIKRDSNGGYSAGWLQEGKFALFDRVRSLAIAKRILQSKNNHFEFHKTTQPIG